MFQRRSIAHRVFGVVRKIAFGLGAFLLLQYVIFSLPHYLDQNGLLSGAMWPIVFLIAIAYAASAVVFLQNVWRG